MRKIRPYIMLYGAVALITSVSGCAKKDDTAVLAMVGDRVISSREFTSRIAKLPSYYQTVVARNREKFLDDLIVEEIFYEEAVRTGLTRDRETQDVIKEAKKKILIARLLKKEVEDKIRIDESEARKYYEEHKDEFKSPEMWRASHILVATEAEAQEIQNGIAALGWDFEEMAKARSRDATAKRGGDIGMFTKGQLVPEFEEACMKLEVGSPCEIVKTQFGYHVIKVTEKVPTMAEEFGKVRSSIEDQLRRARRKILFNELIANLKKKYNVKVETDALKEMAEKSKPAKEKAPPGNTTAP